MSRVLVYIAAACVLAGAGSVWAEPAGLEMDVLELDEAPEQALKRVTDSRRRGEEQAGRAGEAPEVGPFIPDDSLGSRGLVGVLPEAVEDLDSERPGKRPARFDPGDLWDRLPGKDKDDKDHKDDEGKDDKHGDAGDLLDRDDDKHGKDDKDGKGGKKGRG